MAEQEQEDKSMTQEERDARAERIKNLLQERGEDVAKLVKTWLHKDD